MTLFSRQTKSTINGPSECCLRNFKPSSLRARIALQRRFSALVDRCLKFLRRSLLLSSFDWFFSGCIVSPHVAPHPTLSPGYRGEGTYFSSNTTSALHPTPLLPHSRNSPLTRIIDPHPSYHFEHRRLHFEYRVSMPCAWGEHGLWTDIFATNVLPQNALRHR